MMMIKIKTMITNDNRSIFDDHDTLCQEGHKAQKIQDHQNQNHHQPLNVISMMTNVDSLNVFTKWVSTIPISDISGHSTFPNDPAPPSVSQRTSKVQKNRARLPHSLPFKMLGFMCLDWHSMEAFVQKVGRECRSNTCAVHAMSSNYWIINVNICQNAQKAPINE